MKKFNQLHQNQMILVKSVGNQFEQQNRLEERGLHFIRKHIKAIFVGGSNFFGLSQNFSEENEVTILAPSDGLVQTHIKENSFSGITFGGTSASAPMVTAALSNVISIIGDITLDEAKILLKKTSLKGINSFSKEPSQQVGILNAYKLVVVADQLKKMNWHSGDSKVLEQNDLYNFDSIADDLRNSGIQCFNEEHIMGTFKEKCFDLIRKSFFLNQNKKAALFLSQYYLQNHHYWEALFYQGFVSQPEEFLQQLLQSEWGYARVGILKTALNVLNEKKAKKLIRKMMLNNDVSPKEFYSNLFSAQKINYNDFLQDLIHYIKKLRPAEIEYEILINNINILLDDAYISLHRFKPNKILLMDLKKLAKSKMR